MTDWTPERHAAARDFRSMLLARVWEPNTIPIISVLVSDYVAMVDELDRCRTEIERLTALLRAAYLVTCPTCAAPFEPHRDAWECPHAPQEGA